VVRSCRGFVDATGQFDGFEPIPAEELADGQQAERLGAGRELVTPAGVLSGGLEPPGAEIEQARSTVPLVGLEG
jgi:hypothetical protein